MPEDIIQKNFNALTFGLDPKPARIALYEHIRDIPYAIIAELRDPVTGPVGLLKLNQGSCVPKHFLLAQMFTKLEIPVKYVTYLFDWDDPRIRYPEELRKLTRRMPVSAHLALKVNINGKWVLIDATWDKPLKEFGFPVNESWDGVSDTKLAVIPLEEIVHSAIEDRLIFSDKQKKGFLPDQQAAYADFAEKLNSWLEKIR